MFYLQGLIILLAVFTNQVHLVKTEVIERYIFNWCYCEDITL